MLHRPKQMRANDNAHHDRQIIRRRLRINHTIQPKQMIQNKNQRNKNQSLAADRKDEGIFFRSFS